MTTATNSVWKNTVLPVNEAVEYTKIVNEIANIRRSDSRDLLCNTILESDAYSLNFKQKLAFAKPAVKTLRLWACRNFKSELLYKFIEKLIALDLYFVDDPEMEALISNPSFISSAGSNHDSLKLFIRSLVYGTRVKSDISTHLVEALFRDNLMNFAIAEVIISINTDIQVRGLKTRTNETLILEWVRTQYDMGNDVPDSWVRRFVQGSA